MENLTRKMSTQRPKVFVFLNKYQILMLSLLIIKFHVIHLNPASCKCCNTVPQTLLLDSHGYSPYPKKFTRSNQGPDKLCHWRNYLGGTGKCFFHLLQSRWECVPVRKFGNVQDVRVMGAFLASNHTLHLKVIHI